MSDSDSEDPTMESKKKRTSSSTATSGGDTKGRKRIRTQSPNSIDDKVIVAPATSIQKTPMKKKSGDKDTDSGYGMIVAAKRGRGRPKGSIKKSSSIKTTGIGKKIEHNNNKKGKRSVSGGRSAAKGRGRPKSKETESTEEDDDDDDDDDADDINEDEENLDDDIEGSAAVEGGEKNDTTADDDSDD